MSSGAVSSYEVLRQFTRRGQPVKRCDLCGSVITEGHPHLMDPRARQLFCACRACSILFSNDGTSKYKRVPERVLALTDFCLSDAQWNGLMIPINMAFLFRSSVNRQVVALYPSPAGATESHLALKTWNAISSSNPVLSEMADDVEALLINRLGAAHGFEAPLYFVLPIDECFRLVGVIRKHWRGFSGGREVWEELRKFFVALQLRAAV